MQDQTGDDVDLFAGPGGWDEGNRMLGRPGPIGYELDPGACATAEAAGHKRVLADLLTMAPHEHRGGMASPPCQGFSLAGLRRGLGDSAHILEEIARPRVEPQRLAEHCADPRSALVVVPLSWALAARPAWTCWEQVPAVLPLWQACAERLRAEGYSAWAGLLHAEQAGVPQARTRAFLLASRDKDVAPPTPTHSRYWNRTPGKLDPGVAKWVSMAEALELEPGRWMRSNYGTGGDPRNRGIRSDDQPAPTITSKAGRNFWHFAGKSTAAWVPVAANEGSQKGSIRVTVQEAAVLQSFPADYPWQGSRTAQFGQVGNAVPPLLAAHVIAAVAT